MTPIYENYRSETPVYFHYATGSKTMKFLCLFFNFQKIMKFFCLVLNFWPRLYYNDFEQ